MPITFTTATEVPDDVAILVVPVLSGGVVPPDAPAELHAEFLEARGFEGTLGQTQPLMADDGSTILAVGIGDADRIDLEVIRRAGAATAKGATRATRIAVALLDVVPEGIDGNEAAQALVEGIVLGAHQFTAYKSSATPSAIEEVVVVGRAGSDIQPGLDRGARVAEAVALARDLVNRPARDMTPEAAGWVDTSVPSSFRASVVGTGSAGPRCMSRLMPVASTSAASVASDGSRVPLS